MLNWIGLVCLFALGVILFGEHAQRVEGGWVFVSWEVFLVEMCVLVLLMIVVLRAIRKKWDSDEDAAETKEREERLRERFANIARAAQGFLDDDDAVRARGEATHMIRLLQADVGMDLEEADVYRYTAALTMLLVDVARISETETASWRRVIAQHAKRCSVGR